MHSSRRLLLLVAMLVALPGTLTGCSITSHANKVEEQITDAINSVDQQSADWQQTLVELEAKLQQDASADANTALAQVNLLLQNSIASAGGELRCNADFIGTRVSQALQRIKASLFGGAAPARVPHLCQIVPSSIKVQDVQSGALQVLDIHGYDLQPGSLSFELQFDNGAFARVDASKAANPTDYEATLNLSRSNGVSIPANAQKLSILSALVGGSVIGDMTIEQPPPPPPVMVPVLVQNLKIHFHTNDDDKDDDTGVSAVIGGGAVAAWRQTSKEVFPDHGDKVKDFSPSQVELRQLSEAQFEICIAPNGNDTWRFNWQISGTRSDSGQPINAEQTGKGLDQDHTCVSLHLPKYPGPYEVPQLHVIRPIRPSRQ